MGWNFKRLNSEGELVEITNSGKIKLYHNALTVARDSARTNPKFSKYHVREAIGDNHIFFGAGNFEYGCCQSLHGEESAVAVWKSQGMPKIPILGVVNSDPAGTPATPCGNCRDIMRDTLGEDFELVSGNVHGGIAVVAPIKDFLFNDFKPFGFDDNYRESMKLPIMDMLERCQKFKFDVYAPKDVHPERQYVAAIKGNKDWYYGALRLRCEFHPTYALERAVMQAEANNDPEIQKVWIACKDHMPDVMYRDRQNLLELNLDNQLLLMNSTINPTIYLFNYSTEPTFKINETRITTVEEWLPHPFTPRAFGNFVNTDLTPWLEKKYGGW